MLDEEGEPLCFVGRRRRVMGNFQESRVSGLTSKAIWVSLVVVGIVVALYFIPQMIQGKFSSRGAQSAAMRNSNTRQTLKDVNIADKDRASLDSGSLHDIAANLDRPNQNAAVKDKQLAVDDQTNKKSGGIFSGWDLNVKARRNSEPGSKELPKGVSLTTLNTRESAGFFKRGRGDVQRFMDKNKIKEAGPREAVFNFLNTVDLVSNGLGKTQDQATVANQLIKQNYGVVQSFSASGIERGLMMQWIELPLISMIDSQRGNELLKTVQNAYSPRVVLRSVTVRQKGQGTAGKNGQAFLTAEMAVKGTDVESIGLYHSGVFIREIRPGKPDAEGLRTFRINGDASGVWAFMANDKYGSRPYAKAYSFYPRVRRFRQNEDGSFNIAFHPRSARNSIDKYFAIAVSGGSANKSSDPAVTIF